MNGTARAKDRFNWWGIVASTALHILLCAFVLLLPAPPQIPVPREEGVDVVIVRLPPVIAKEKHELPRQAPLLQPHYNAWVDKPEGRPDTPTLPEERRSRDEAPAMVRPSRMLSKKILDDPRSGQVRAIIAQLRPDDQIEQLCGIEAMAQVGEWNKEFQPDRVVAYAMVDPKIVGNAFSAEGAALHSKRDWYRLQFKCEVTPDRQNVAAFEFLVGEPIPRENWEEHSLPDEGRPLD